MLCTKKPLHLLQPSLLHLSEVLVSFYYVDLKQAHSHTNTKQTAEFNVDDPLSVILKEKENVRQLKHFRVIIMPQKKFIKETQLHYKSLAFLNPIF